MLNIKVSYIVTHITLTLGGLLVLVHVAVATGQLEVEKDAEFPKKLLVKLTYTDGEGLNVGSITDADYQSNCFCRAGHNTPLYNCETSLNYEKIVDITWSNRNVIIRRKPDCSSDSSYSFNVLVHVAVTTEQLEVKQDAEFPNKLFVKLTYSASEELNAGSITDADFQSHCFCRVGHNAPLYECATSLNYEKIVDITWSDISTIIRRKPDCSSDSRYSFNVTTTNIQVGLERNEDGDELNVTLVCVDTFNHIYVNDESQQSDRIRLEFSKQSGNDNLILRFLRSAKRLVSSVATRIWSYSSSPIANNNGIRFNCGVAITTTASSAQSDSTVSTNPTPETTIGSTTRLAIPSTTTRKTNPTTNQNSTEHTNEQDLVLMVVIPVVAVVVIIVVIIIVVVIRVSGKSPSVNEGGDYEGLANNRTSARVYAELNQINDENPNQPGSIEMNYENFPPAPYYENVPTLTQATVDPTADAYESID